MDGDGGGFVGVAVGGADGGWELEWGVEGVVARLLDVGEVDVCGFDGEIFVGFGVFDDGEDGGGGDDGGGDFEFFVESDDFG